MTRIAAGSESIDVEDWMPSRIYLSVPLMWDILTFNCMADSREISRTGLLDSSLSLADASNSDDESSTLDIIVATSPEITVNTADGGQDAPTVSYKSRALDTPQSTASRVDHNEISAEHVDSLTFNTTPWLYADPAQLDNVGYMDLDHHDTQSNVSDSSGMQWWASGTFADSMFAPV